MGKNARNFHYTMPECTCGTIYSSETQTSFTSSPTWPTFSVTMTPEWTFQKWYIKPSFLGGRGCAWVCVGAPFCWEVKEQLSNREQKLYMNKWGASSSAALHSSFKSTSYWREYSRPANLHQLTAQCPSISAVFGWGPGGSRRGMGYFGERRVPERNNFFHRGATAKPCGAITSLS